VVKFSPIKAANDEVMLRVRISMKKKALSIPELYWNCEIRIEGFASIFTGAIRTVSGRK
jgi:hypothetical protein